MRKLGREGEIGVNVRGVRKTWVGVVLHSARFTISSANPTAQFEVCLCIYLANVGYKEFRTLLTPSSALYIKNRIVIVN